MHLRSRRGKPDSPQIPFATKLKTTFMSRFAVIRMRVVSPGKHLLSIHKAFIYYMHEQYIELKDSDLRASRITTFSNKQLNHKGSLAK